MFSICIKTESIWIRQIENLYTPISIKSCHGKVTWSRHGSQLHSSDISGFLGVVLVKFRCVLSVCEQGNDITKVKEQMIFGGNR